MTPAEPRPTDDEKTPTQILAFDSTKKRETVPVDLDSPFFIVRQRPSYPACDHRDRGVTLDMATRKVFCLCEEEIDAFDALLIYAHAQRRLISHAEAIREHERKEAEKKARRPFVRRVVAMSKRERFGYDVKLECGHSASLWREKRLPRSVTCDQCKRAHDLQQRGVGVVQPQGKLKEITLD